ncbi:hypothetical protein ABIA39_001804 [Nocardia sp. GAS34]
MTCTSTGYPRPTTMRVRYRAMDWLHAVNHDLERAVFDRGAGAAQPADTAA